jgi:hypothetical protein
LGDYTALLARAPLSAQTRRTYAAKVRQFLVWLQTADTTGDPLCDQAARDWAVRDYRSYLHTTAKRAPATVNNALAAIDDFYTRLGLGQWGQDYPADARGGSSATTCPSPRGSNEWSGGRSPATCRWVPGSTRTRPSGIGGNSAAQPLTSRSSAAVSVIRDCRHVSDQPQRQQWRPVAASLPTPRLLGESGYGRAPRDDPDPDVPSVQGG